MVQSCVFFFLSPDIEQPQIIVKVFNINQSDIFAIQLNQGDAFV